MRVGRGFGEFFSLSEDFLASSLACPGVRDPISLISCIVERMTLKGFKISVLRACWGMECTVYLMLAVLLIVMEALRSFPIVDYDNPL